MIVKKMNWFVKAITFGWATAICIAPFGIYIKEGHFVFKVINHEKIHWKQQMEMFIIPFYLWYFIEWVIRLFINGKYAYQNICFEREAQGYEYDDNYLIVRKQFAWIKYECCSNYDNI